MKFSLLFFMALVVLSCSRQNTTDAYVQPLKIQENKRLNRTEDVSIIALIANPDKYDQKSVRTVGAVNLGFESNIICVHAEDFKKGLLKNCLSVNFDYGKIDFPKDKWNRLNQNYVGIEGVFYKDYKGHMDGNSGGVHEITFIYLLNDSD